jgi:diguanylate cyclase (GGDEF)-like protein/PAS domain S-box-containing protein
LETATLQSVTEAIPAVVAVVGADERYRFVNRALEEFMGLPREQILGRRGIEILGEIEYRKSKPWVDKVLAGDTVSYEKTFTTRHTPVHMAINLIPLRVSETQVDGFVVVAQDITRHHVEAARLLRLAERDPLTGLLNRAGFDSYMHDAIASGDAARLALLYIDLDHFKPVNDTHGHPVGDQVLRQFAQRLKTLVRPTDAVARIGGDEFAVVLAGVREVAHAEAVADKVVEVAHTVFEVGGLPLSIGASVGLAIDASGEDGLERIIARADGMLYRAKAAGRGTRRG